MRSKYRALPAAVSKPGLCSRACPPRFMATAPAAAPQRKTSVKVTAQTILASHDLAKDAFSSKLGLIGGQRDQHVVLGTGGEKGRGILLGHYRFRRKAGRILAFPHDQITAQDREGQQRGERQTAAESQIQREEPREGRHCFALPDLLITRAWKPGAASKVASGCKSGCKQTNSFEMSRKPANSSRHRSQALRCASTSRSAASPSVPDRYSSRLSITTACISFFPYKCKIPPKATPRESFASNPCPLSGYCQFLKQPPLLKPPPSPALCRDVARP